MLDPGVTKVPVELEHYDLSLENRRKTSNEVVARAAEAMREARFGIKAATVTPEGADDVGSPNRLLREAIDGKVIIRTGRRIPGVTPVAGVHYPIAVVRMAVGDAYGAEQWREEEDGDEVAYRTERISRSVCRAVAEYSFRTAARIHGRVYGGPKWTVSPVYEGMLKEEMDDAAGAPSRGALQPGADRRHLRRPDLRRGRRAARDPGAEPRRRLPLGPRDADVRLDRRRRVGAARVRRRLRAERRDGGGAARDRAGAARQGHRQPDGDDPGRGGGAPLRVDARPRAAPTRPRARSTSRCSRPPPPASARPTWAATRAPPSSPTR